MSQVQLEKFVSRISNNPAELEQAAKGTQDPEEFVRNVLAYAKQNGYDFTEQEGRAWLEQHGRELGGGELNDAQLEAVAGGKGGSKGPVKYKPPVGGAGLVAAGSLNARGGR